MDLKQKTIVKSTHPLFLVPLSAFISELITFPLEAIKTHFQTSQQYKSLLDCAKSIKPYKGLQYSLYRTLAFHTIHQVTLEQSNILMTGSIQETTFNRKWIMQFMAGCTALIFCNRLDILRIRAILNQEKSKKVYWKGIYLNMAIYFQFAFIDTAFRNKLRNLYIKNLNLNKDKKYADYCALTSICVGVSFLSSPLDVIKTRYMNANQESLWNICKQCFKPFNYFRGVQAYSIRTATFYLTYSLIQDELKLLY